MTKSIGRSMEDMMGVNRELVREVEVLRAQVNRLWHENEYLRDQNAELKSNAS